MARKCYRRVIARKRQKEQRVPISTANNAFVNLLIIHNASKEQQAHCNWLWGMATYYCVSIRKFAKMQILENAHNLTYSNAWTEPKRVFVETSSNKSGGVRIYIDLALHAKLEIYMYNATYTTYIKHTPNHVWIYYKYRNNQYKHPTTMRNKGILYSLKCYQSPFTMHGVRKYYGF